MSFGKEPVTIVEIDQDYCSQSYGVAPCLAQIGVTGPDKCFKTYRSCQYASAWTKSALALRFNMPIMEQPLEWESIPSVSAISIEPTRLNVGGAQQSSKSLGMRGKCSITFSDHPDGDIKTDPYLADRAYDAFSRSTFWAKWLSRNAYYKNRPLRIYQGYLGQLISEMRVSHYIIDKLVGPDSSGRVKIDAVDILRLADDDKAAAPALSLGELLADITISATSFSITGALEAEYDAAGTVRIGDEIMTYTARAQNGAQVDFTGVTRATDGTIADAHSLGDKVQKCIRYDAAMPNDVAYDLLVNYAGVDSAFIPVADWTIEADNWLTQFTVSTVISEPAGINSLLSSLTQECLFYVWWDENAQLIKLRAVRPATEEVTSWTQGGHILAGTITTKEDVNQRSSRVWIYYQPSNWALDLENEATFRKARLAIDPTSESPSEYDETKTRTIYCRWIRTDAQALYLGARYLSRYRDNQKLLTVSVDADQRAVSTADIVDVTASPYVDFYGNQEPRRFQVISRKEIQSGEVVQYELQEFQFAGQRFAFWMADNAPAYSIATEVDKRTGGWWSDVDGKMVNGDDGYTWQ